MSKKTIRSVAVELFGKDVGCHDHSCIYGHPGGMGTNGGCGCLNDTGVELRRHVMRLQRIALELAKQLDRKGLESFQ